MIKRKNLRRALKTVKTIKLYCDCIIYCVVIKSIYFQNISTTDEYIIFMKIS